MLNVFSNANHTIVFLIERYCCISINVIYMGRGDDLPFKAFYIKPILERKIKLKALKQFRLTLRNIVTPGVE